jgi:hypothetical protein
MEHTEKESGEVKVFIVTAAGGGCGQAVMKCDATLQAPTLIHLIAQKAQ